MSKLQAFGRFRLLEMVSNVFVFLIAAAICSLAQTFATVFSFDHSDGRWPYYGSHVQGLDGDFKGRPRHEDGRVQGVRKERKNHPSSP